MHGWVKLTWVEAKLFLRNPLAAFFALAFPLLLLFLYGSIYGNNPLPLYGGHGMVDVYAPAYIAMVIATNGLVTVPNAIANYRESGVLLRLQATPLRPLALLLAEFTGNFVMTVVGALLIIVTGALVYHMHFLGDPLSMLAAFVLSCLSFFAFGFVLASVLPTAYAVQVVAYLLFFPMLFLSGVGYPTQLMPQSLQNIAQFLPLTYVVKLLQGLWLGESWGAHLKDVLILAGLLVVSVIVSARFFRWK
jgi:ABC-2 type transport system permease protein